MHKLKVTGNKSILKKRLVVYFDILKQDNSCKHNDPTSKTNSYDNYKLGELKQKCKENKLKVTGTKKILIDRLIELQNKNEAATNIQKLIRKTLVQNWIKFKGPALQNRSLCNNTTDYVTLEPIQDIPFEYFISFKDSNNFIYGFDITSLISSIQIHGKTKNPYTREKFSKRLIQSIKSAFNTTCILYADFKKENKQNVIKYSINQRNTNIRSSQNSPRIIQQRPLRNTLRLTVDNYEYRPHYNPSAFTEGSDLQETWVRINNIRRRSVQERIDNLFIEIDLLGNYTQSRWFSNLSYNQYVRFFRYLSDIWMFRSNMSFRTKLNICPYYNPFDGIFPQGAEVNQDILRMGCLLVFENMVYCGINEDFRKIGTLHALSALTLVSAPARESFPWLYDSVRFS